MFRMLRKKKAQSAVQKAQSTVEYILLVTTVIGVVILFLVSPTSPFRDRLNRTYNVATQDMVDIATRLSNTHFSLNSDGR